MRLTFDRERVKKIIEFTKANTPRAGLPGQCILLAADYGVYLIPGTEERMEDPESQRAYIAYADQVNPDTMDPDAVLRAKNDSFGWEDGFEVIPLEVIEDALRRGQLVIGLTPDMTEIKYA